MPTIWVSLNLDFRMTAPWTRAVYVQLSIDRGSLRSQSVDLQRVALAVALAAALTAAAEAGEADGGTP